MTNIETPFNVTFPAINLEPLNAAIRRFAENLADSMDSVGCEELTLASGDTLRLQYGSTFSGSYRVLALNETGNLEDGVSFDPDSKYSVHGDPHHQVRPAAFRSGIDVLTRRTEWTEALRDYCHSLNDSIMVAISG